MSSVELTKRLRKEIYSTKETFTGRYWVDGKKIYRKIVTGTLPSQNYETFIDMSFANEIIDENIRVKDGTATLVMPSVNLINNVYLNFYIDDSNIYHIHFSASTYGGKSFKAIIEYTKTTD